MRDVNEIITRNAKQMLERAEKKGLEEGLVVDEGVIATRMAGFMGAKVDSTKKGLHRYLHENHKWRVDYVEAFGRAVGRDMAWMVQPHTPKDIREATSAQVLVSAVDRRLEQPESRKLARILNQLLDHRPFYDLVVALAERVLDGKSADSVALEASDLVRESAAWSRKVRRLRGKQVSDKKS